MIAWYLDTSAILKLIVLENESLALRAFIGKENITSMYTRLEVARTLKNYSQEVHRTAGLILKNLISRANRCRFNLPSPIDNRNKRAKSPRRITCSECDSERRIDCRNHHL